MSENEDILDLGAPPIEESKNSAVNISDEENDPIANSLGNLPTHLPEPPSVLKGEHVNQSLIILDPAPVRHYNSRIQRQSEEAKAFTHQAESWLLTCDSTEHYSVDYRDFPIYFQTDDEALNTYNALGLEKKLHFKKFNMRRDEKNFLIKFGLA